MLNAARCYLLVEALNFDATVFDTNQISIVRGSSLLASDAIRDIHQNILPPPHEKISTGASSGLFRLAPDSKSEAIVDKIVTLLSNTDTSRGVAPYGHLTFGVEVCESTDFRQALAIMRSQLATNQLRGLTTVTDGSTGSGVCYYSGVRATTEQCTIHPEKGITRQLSRSAYNRLVYGVQQRQRQYRNDQQVLGDEYIESDYDVTRDLQALAHCEAMGNLHNKIAVIYADGNRFSQARHSGSLSDTKAQAQAQAQETQKALQHEIDFDQSIQQQRASFRNQALNAYATDTDRFPQAFTQPEAENSAKNKPQLRFETLLWGGDDMLLVVPAWYGFEWLRLLFEFTWRFNGQALTHSAGIVLCNAKTPVARSRQLAFELCERVKIEQTTPKNGFDYVILESIDYLTTTPDNYFIERYGNELAKLRPHSIDARLTMSQTLGNCQKLIKEEYLSARSVHTIASNLYAETLYPFAAVEHWQTAVCNSSETATPLLQLEREYIASHPQKSASEVCVELASVFNALGCTDDALRDDRNRAWCWLHLYELWNYLLPTASIETPAAASRGSEK